MTQTCIKDKLTELNNGRSEINQRIYQNITWRIEMLADDKWKWSTKRKIGFCVMPIRAHVLLHKYFLLIFEFLAFYDKKSASFDEQKRVRFSKISSH